MYDLRVRRAAAHCTCGASWFIVAQAGGIPPQAHKLGCPKDDAEVTIHVGPSSLLDPSPANADRDAAVKLDGERLANVLWEHLPAATVHALFCAFVTRYRRERPGTKLSAPRIVRKLLKSGGAIDVFVDDEGLDPRQFK